MGSIDAMEQVITQGGKFYNLTDFIYGKPSTTVINGRTNTRTMKTLDEMEKEFEKELEQKAKLEKLKQSTKTNSLKKSEKFEKISSNSVPNVKETSELLNTQLKPRLYQETILGTCSFNNTLVVLPTGMGKTMIAMLLAANRLKTFPNSKILVLAPTRPLVEQHLHTFRKHTNLTEDETVLFTGHVKPEKRAEQWKTAKAIFSTPQGLENDVLSGRIKLTEVSLIVFDEAHRATGDYSYVFLAKKYDSQATYSRVLALTASPGSDAEKIIEVCQNLKIEAVEVRTDEDPDVKPYIQDVELKWISVQFPEQFKKLHSYLQESYKSKIAQAKNYGYIKNGSSPSKTELLRVQGFLHKELSKGFKDEGLFKSISLIAEAMKVQHAIELIETQGVTPLVEYLDKLETEAVQGKSKAAKNLSIDINFKSAKIIATRLNEEGVEHPKVQTLVDLITKETINPNQKIILFNQYRDSALKLKTELDLAGISNQIFFGQAKKKGRGHSQKEQKQILNDFRFGKFQILISTSVGEEGLDIPKVDSVIFYEPIPSAIRTIQRRGRTGRSEKGKVFVLMTKGTRDEGYRWSAHHKEKRMYRVLEEIRKGFEKAGLTKQTQKYVKPLEKSESKLTDFISEKPLLIYADHREKSNTIVKEMSSQGIHIELKQLTLGDYQLSKRVIVELKKVSDFVDSIIDGRLLDQVKRLKSEVERPVIIIEGEENIYSQRKIHPNAIRGMIATITISFGIPIIQTRNVSETAALLLIMAKREQDEFSSEYSMHGSRKPITVKEQVEYIVSSLPGIGPGLAKPLLEKFKTIKNIVNATEDELKEVAKIGDKKAKEIQKVLTQEWI
ncbi:DEAD/DEAH box helicase [Candidatus Woesearchaeota archaeon]|nr:DEAD/DEAH box helicase [Candidatus Woesearchaeota archaeon]